MAAVAVRVLVQILLVVVLCEVIREVAGRLDLGCDVTKAALADDPLVGVARCQSYSPLCIVRVIDGTAILRANVISLPVALRGIVAFPKSFENFVGGNFCRSIHHERGLGMPGSTRAHFLVGGIEGETAKVTHAGRVDPGQLPVELLSTPEAPQSEIDGLGVSWPRPLQRSAKNAVHGGHVEDRRGPAGERLIGVDHRCFRAEESHRARVTRMDGFNTRAIHAGQEPDALTGAVVPPIYQVSTYAQDGVGGLRGGYEYSRSANPTRDALQECLAALEAPGIESARALAFASGLAAEDTVIRTVLKPGGHAVIPNDAYGGTFRLFAKVAAPWGVDYTPANLQDPQAVADAIIPGRTALVWVETPTNPLLNIADIAAIAEVTHAAGALLVVDNTFASPYLQQPLALGADIVVHSTTKYLGGHSDVIGGALIVTDPDLAERLAFHQNAMGAVPGPFDSWLVLRGVKTLGVRMDRHCSNAQLVADFLVGHPRVSEVLWPGLESHPGYEVARRQMRDFGGMVSFRMKDGEQAALDVCAATELFILGESLGGVESLIEHPARMTHASAAGSPLEVPADLIRLSVGIEESEDLLSDLEKALS